MNTAPRLQVEIAPTTFFVRGNSSLLDQVQEALLAKGLETSSDLESADYLISWGPDHPQVDHPRQFDLIPYPDWFSPKSSQGQGTKIYLGSLYGVGIIESRLKDWIQEYKQTNKITLPGDGLSKHYLLSSQDAVETLVQAILSRSYPGKYYLFSQEHSYISLANLLQGVIAQPVEVVYGAVEVRDTPPIDHTQLDSNQSQLKVYLSWLVDQVSVENPATPTLTPLVPIKPQSIKTPPIAPPILKSKPQPRSVQFEPIHKPVRIPKLSFSFKPNLPKLPRNTAFFKILIVSFIGIMLYASSLMASFLGVLHGIKTLSKDLDRGQGSSYRATIMATRYLAFNTTALGIIPALTEVSDQSARGLESLIHSFELAGSLGELKTSFEGIAESILLGKNLENLTPNISFARLGIEQVYDKLALIEATLPSHSPEFLGQNFAARYGSLRQTIASARKSILQGKALLAILPDLVAVGERRQYALLLQNNMELRPTGGFIGSFAILSFENGHLYDLQVHDVYSADGQLKGYVEPPEPIRRYLGEASWYMRDSNWDPEFSSTRDKVQWYLKKTLNLDVDGAIGINLNTIKEILQRLGPLQVPEYGETITSDNLYARTQFHAEVGFFPGSTQKKEFLGSLATSLLLRLESADSQTLMKITKAALNSASSQDITVSVNNPNTNRVLSHLGWSGELKSGACDQVNCVASYLNIVDANLGVNKANYFVKRKLDLVIDLDENLHPTHTLTISSQNTAPNSSWPAGPYKNYQRLYLPAGVELISLERDGIAIPDRDIDQSLEHGKTVIGYLVTTPILESSTLVAKYKLSPSVPKDSPSFSFYWQKQPGTQPDPLRITLNYPLYLQPVVISPESTVNPHQLVFELTNNSDRRILVNFNSR